MPITTPIFPETRPGRICATPLRMAELAETRQRDHDDVQRPPAPHGAADSRPGVPTPWSDHTNVPIDIITITDETIDQTFHGTCLDFGVADCKCCGFVGTEDKSKKSKSKAKRITFCHAYVGPVGKCNGNGNGNSNGNCSGKCNNQASCSEASVVLFDEL